MKSTHVFLLSCLLIAVLTQQIVQAVPAQQITIDNSIPASIISHGQQQALEIQQQAAFQEELNQNIPPWIQQELETVQSVIELPITETFTFIVKSQQEIIFKWDPSKEKELKIIVDVFYVTRSGDLQVIKDAQENQYIEIMAKNPDGVFYGLIGKVYRSKILTVDFDTDFKYLKFTNKNSQTVLIEIDVQKLSYVVSKGVKDDSLTISSNKMSSILQQTQSTQIRREHVYKWQWGYLQNEQNHQHHILGLTGIELFTIIITAIVQMYSLKGLLDNRAVV